MHFWSKLTEFNGNQILNTFKFDMLNINDVFKLSAAILTGSIVIYLGKIWLSYGFFKKLGIKTPKYRFLYGNIDEFKTLGYASALRHWTEQLGKTYGLFFFNSKNIILKQVHLFCMKNLSVYEGHLPILVTSDIELIQEIFIKKFSYFSPRKLSPHISSDNDPNLDIFTSGRDKWKRMRTLMNPTFTNKKIQKLLPLMIKCSDRIIEVIDNNQNKVLFISDYLDRLTMDSLFNCAFGVDINPQKNPDDLFLNAGLAHFKNRVEYSFIFMLRYLFHEFKPVINGLYRLISVKLGMFTKRYIPAIFILYANINRILEKRLQEKTYKNDYAQILIENCSDTFDDRSKLQFTDFNDMRIEKRLSPQEIKANLVIFLLAGFETTSSSLGYSIYMLAKHPDEMKKIQNEIDLNLSSNNNDDLTIDDILNLSYLDMFFKEVLRMYPIANGAITRRCVEPITLKNINFPVGLTIAVDVLSLHYSDEYWHNPNEFNPSRFQTEEKINPLVYIPFGIGPRMCIGMKFALLEVKLTLVKMLRKYDILACEQTPQELEYLDGIVRRPKHGIPVVFKRRT